MATIQIDTKESNHLVFLFGTLKKIFLSDFRDNYKINNYVLYWWPHSAYGVGLVKRWLGSLKYILLLQFCSRRAYALFWSPCVSALTCKHTFIYTAKINIKKTKRVWELILSQWHMCKRHCPYSGTTEMLWSFKRWELIRVLVGVALKGIMGPQGFCYNSRKQSNTSTTEQGRNGAHRSEAQVC